MNQVKQFFTRYKMLALVIAIAVIWLFFSWQTEGGFLTPRNLSNLLRQMSITGILVCGMVLVIISGEIDLSVGSMLGLLGGLAAILDVVYHVPLLANLSVVALCGLMIGLANGYMTAYLRIPSFIVGLVGMLAFRGILLGITGGTTVAPVSPSLVYVGQGYLPHSVGTGLGVLLLALTLFLTWKQRRNRALHGLAAHSMVRDVLRVVIIGAVLGGFVYILNSYDGIPVPVLLLLVLLGVFSYVTSQTVFGRRVYAVGSNMEATRLSGINVQAVKLWIFGIMGELDAIAACFIGGTSMRGGSGTVYGALLGALVITSLDNGMSMLDVDSYWQMIVKGGILVLAVWVDVSTRAGRR
ncbi:sugar ABC transporter permease [Pseudomonas avellanae]|uniref:sugar ABC transporter permease n=1 Tax=Pseudomonas avellanae TaxID=46257 RepID=UPI00040C5FE3|nr:sugar ABC transporter permease [Pseudomonas avellanae]